MEDLASRWKKLSLSEAEGKKCDLSKDKKQLEHVLAAKFFTRRPINVEVVARTFRPIWRTKRKFEVSLMGDNILLFEFELETNIEKVLQGEPWVFDRHLVALQQFDGSMPVQELSFDKANFWVQIHNLPFSLMTVEAAVNLGESLGVVAKPKDIAEMRGGNFMRVRVAVDVTKPLCRGRMITWDHGIEGWMPFMYERLPNIYYWCSHLSHDDKECEVWLSSKGKLAEEEQQYGPWLRAPQFNPTRKTIVEVQGFEILGSHRNPLRGTVDCYPTQQPVTLNVTDLARVTISSAAEKLQSIPVKPTMMAEMSNDGGQIEDGHVPETDTAGALNQILDFEAMIRDIDDAINTKPVFSNSKADNSESSVAIIGEDLNFRSNGSITKDLGSLVQILKKEEDELTSRNSRISPMEVKFEMGRVGVPVEGKANKNGPKRSTGKGKNNDKHQHGPAIGNGENKWETKEGLKLGSWTRLHVGPKV